MLQRLGIRGKLLAVVMVPVLVLVAAAAYITTQAMGDYRDSSNAAQLIDALGEARSTQAAIQDERTEALNFVHLVQDTSEKLAAAQDEVETRYDTLVSRAEAADDDRADAVLDQATAALGGTGSAMLADPRSLRIEDADADGWLQFPTAEAVEQMNAQYSEALVALNELSSSAPAALDLRQPVAALAYAVQQEASNANTLYTDPVEYQELLKATFAEVDAGLDAIAAAATEVEPTETNEQALAAVAAGSALRDELPGLRTGVRNAEISTQTVTNFYTEMVDTFVEASRAIAIAVPDRTIVASLQAYSDLDGLIESLRYEGDVFNRLIREGSFVSAEVAQSRTIAERTKIALEEAQASGNAMLPAIAVPDIGASETTTSSSFTTIESGILTGLDSSLVAARSANWPGKVQQEIDQYAPLREEAWATTVTTVDANATNALSAAWLSLAISVAVLVASLIIAFALARRIVDPLRRLTTTASAVREELPRLVERVAQPGETVDVSEVQIPVESSDEVGRLAEAFNGVNAATIEIAREQAALRGSISEMFVNVARRDQVLLNRQLASIDEMERTEDDPQRLTKLFALDHLATRMRRNSESLLVLAGIDTGRRLRRPMPLSDVVRTASSEIELYERVDLELVVDPGMVGHQALTAAHLIAELLENATVFSDPGSRVVVRTGRTEGGFTVEVVDTGIGMSEAELAEANARVQSSAASEILGAQRLGLFVVGRIARRLGAQVAIASEEGRGTVATVLLPSSLFEGVDEIVRDPSPVAAAQPVAAPEHEEPVAPALPFANPADFDVASYVPASVIDGGSLAGRAAEAVEADDDDSIPLPAGIAELIAADEAAAPEATPVVPEELSSGVSESTGLPVRRRRGEPAPAEQDERSVMGLPVRATPDQLDALEAESSAFTPSLAASEVEPQTPEQRASVFRGFLARREAASGTDLPEQHDAPVDATPPVMAEALGEPVEAEEQAAVAPTRPTAAQLGGAFAAMDALRRSSARAVEQRDDAPAEPVEVVGPVPWSEQGEDADSGDAVAAVAEPAPDALADEAVASLAAELPDVDVPAGPMFAMPKLAVTDGPSLPSRRSGLVPAGDEEEPVAEESVLERSPYMSRRAEPEPETAVEEQQAAVAEPTIESDVEEPVDALPEPVAEPRFETELEAQFETFAEAAGPEPVLDIDSGPFTIPGLEPDEDFLVEDEAVDVAEAVAEVPLLAEDDAVDEPVAVQPVAEEIVAEDAVSADSVEEQALVEDTAEQSTAPWFAPVDTPAADAPMPSSWAAFGESAPHDDEEPAAGEPVAEDRIEAEPVAEPVAEPAPEEHTSRAPWLDAAAFAAMAAERESAMYEDAPAEPEPARSGPSEPVAGVGVDSVSIDDGYVLGEATDPSLDEAIAQASGEEAARAGFFGRLFGRKHREESQGEAPAPQRPFAPAAPSFEPQANAPAVAEPDANASAPAPAAPAPQAPTSFEPATPTSFEPAESAGWEPVETFPVTPPPAPGPTAEAPAGGWAPVEHGAMTPEQLAHPAGWESAGASALASPDNAFATTYEPVFDTEHASGRFDEDDDVDLTHAAFSELSSLSSSRPQIEKTKAGLQRRRPANEEPAEVTPIADEVELTPKERDAEATRNRFSSFYSGTQRARSDVAELELRSSPQPANEK